MGWEATGDPRTGGTPGRDAGLPGLPAGFDHGGPWEAAAPSAALAFALERAAGPADLYDGAGTDSNTSDGYVTVTADQYFGYFTGAVGAKV